MLEAEIWGIVEVDGGYMVFIKALKSDYVIPVFIGPQEAHMILTGLGGTNFPRPLTADLLYTLVREGEFTLLRAEISDLKDNTFFALLVLKKPGGGEFLLDSRPSDAIALALRCKSPLFIAEHLIAETGIPVDDLPVAAPLGTEKTKRLKIELDEAVAAENYERAAEIRDILAFLEIPPENS